MTTVRLFVVYALVLAVFISLNLPSPSSAQESAEPVPAYKVGAVGVYVLQDMARSMPVDIFVGASKKELETMAPAGNVPASISVFLLKSGDNIILIDTGLGSSQNPQSQLLDKLKQSGFKPEDVTHVLLTHLHGDHVGGLAWEGKAAFPKAEVLVGEVERQAWLDPAFLQNNPSRKGNVDLIKSNFALYNGRVKGVSFDQEVLPGIKALAAIGHTPGHTVFLLQSQGQRMLFWGDLVHGAALQFANPQICATFDMDMPRAVAARIEFMRMAAEQGFPVAGAHLPAPAVLKVTADGQKFMYAPIEPIK